MEEEKYDPEFYTEQEVEAIENHIERYFGPFDEVLHEIVSPGIHVDICVIKPNAARNYYTLVTMGMGAHEMNVPEQWRDDNTRAEILVTLPSHWNIKSHDEDDYWPVRWLKILARLPGNEDSWLGWGHTVPNGEPFASNTDLSGILLELPYTFGEDSMTCQLPNSETVNFYQMIPLYEEEMEYKVKNGTDVLTDQFDDDFDHVVDIRRKNYCVHVQKTFYLSREQIKPLYESNGPQDCLATDRILVDGCKVGYMYREEPDPDSDMPDSGWRFTAGDEDEEYMDNADNLGVYTLNTICNYDPDIIPLLDAGYGSAFYRDENGKFQKDED